MNHPLEDIVARRSSFVQQHPLMSGGVQRDPVSAFLRDKTFPVRTKLSLDKVPLNRKGIVELAENACWNEIRTLCEKCSQLGLPPHEIIIYRLGLILSNMQLHNYVNASKILESLGDLNNSDLYFYESYPQFYNEHSSYGERRGSMVPWTMLLIKAIMPHFEQTSNAFKAPVNQPPSIPLATPSVSPNGNSVGTPNATTPAPPPPVTEPDAINQLNSHATTNMNGTMIALDRLYRLLNICRKPNLQQKFDAHCSIENWFIREQRVIMMIINCHICKKEYNLAHELLCQVLSKLEDKCNENAEYFDNYILLKSMQGCLYLQTGMISYAESIFDSVKQRANIVNNAKHRIRCLLNDGYVLFAKGKYNDACREFAKILSEDPDNVIAANNQAICLLHMCQLGKAIELLEDVIRHDPTKKS